MEEVWKSAVGYEGFYEVSNLGRVKRIKSFRKNGHGGYIQPEKILKPTIRSKGSPSYYSVHLSVEGKAKMVSVHRLVAEAFIPNPESKEQVNHIDGNKFNNTLSNLEWVTPSENSIHAVKVLNRPFNIKGLALGAEATTKNNLNITNGEYVFQTYNEITEFINNNTNYKNLRKKNITTHVLCCCKGNQKTAYGYNWKFVNDGETRI